MYSINNVSRKLNTKIRAGFIPLETSPARKRGPKDPKGGLSLTGFTLLEIVLVLSLLSIVVVLGASYSILGQRTKTEIDSTTRTVVDVLRRAQNNAVTGEGFTTWGVRFDNG